MNSGDASFKTIEEGINSQCDVISEFPLVVKVAMMTLFYLILFGGSLLFLYVWWISNSPPNEYVLRTEISVVISIFVPPTCLMCMAPIILFARRS